MMNSNDDLQTRLDRIGRWKRFDIDWAHLRELAALGLVDLCALSVGIHPEYARLVREATTLDPDDIPKPEEIAELAAYRNDSITEWERRVRVAWNHAASGTLPVVRNAAPLGGRDPYEAILTDAEKIAVRVADFAAWAKDRGWTLPPEFPTEAPPQIPDEVSEQSAHSGAPEEGPEDGDMETGEIIDESATAAGDEQAEAATLEQEQAIARDDVLARLFDAVKVTQLEAMFPDGGKWTKYAERARRNGLAPAKVARSLFNPYRAALWWIGQGQPGWKWERCLRVLANNLPARSCDSKHLLTGELD